VDDSSYPEPDDRPTGRQVLVTGGAGFIGSHLVDALVSNNDVRVLNDLSSGTREQVDDRAEFIRGDVRDEATVQEAAAGVDIIYHQAAIVSVARSVEQPRTSHTTNVAGTLAVLEAARTADARVVFASSAAIYGEPTRLPISETHPTEPQSPYGLEKLTADRYARLRIAVNNPAAYVAAHRAGFAFTGRETGLAELVCERPADRPAPRDVDAYRSGLDRYRDRDRGPDDAARLEEKYEAGPPPIVDPPAGVGAEPGS